MKFKTFVVASTLALSILSPSYGAEEKVQLDEPKQPDLLAELKEAPDGVLKIKTDEEGNFKSLVVKASVEIEEVLGPAKSKALARKESEIQCKKHLTQWINENCVFVEGSDKTTTIQTKGESSKDAAGNTVKLRSQQGQEVKILKEAHTSMAQATLKGLTVVSSDVNEAGDEFVLVMALTQKSLNQVSVVSDALARRGAAEAVKNGAASEQPSKESKVNRDALDALR